jgi:hypothetical protein
MNIINVFWALILAFVVVLGAVLTENLLKKYE